jgi:hypothetical protein
MLKLINAFNWETFILQGKVTHFVHLSFIKLQLLQFIMEHQLFITLLCLLLITLFAIQ